MSKNDEKKEYGDYQTPLNLAKEICGKLKLMGISPETIIEPTCGLGNFILAAMDEFKKCRKFIGIEVNKEYLNKAELILNNNGNNNLSLINNDFFTMDWFNILNYVKNPILFLGNLPWVTNSSVGFLDGNNLPIKNNFQKISGLNALTGESNFDISEWMLIKIIELTKFIPQSNVYIAFLIKTSVARKILSYLHKNNIYASNISIFNINAKKEFNVSVSACLFICNFANKNKNIECDVFDNLYSLSPKHTLGFSNNVLLNNIKNAESFDYLYNSNQKIWRSGIKHDCSKVMEFYAKEKQLYNGFNEKVEIEETYLYPLFKSSEIANDSTKINKFVLVTQNFIGENTDKIKDTAPKTWKYLNKYKSLLDKRKSIIYKKKPAFSIFGIGEYSFLPWKIAISGLYKKLNFKLVESYNNKPVMFDDTVYFLSFREKDEAEKVYNMLNTQEAKGFLESYIFWDSKRPITANILNKLDLNKLEKVPISILDRRVCIR